MAPLPVFHRPQSVGSQDNSISSRYLSLYPSISRTFLPFFATVVFLPSAASHMLFNRIQFTYFTILSNFSFYFSLLFSAFSFLFSFLFFFLFNPFFLLLKFTGSPAAFLQYRDLSNFLLQSLTLNLISFKGRERNPLPAFATLPGYVMIREAIAPLPLSPPPPHPAS